MQKKTGLSSRCMTVLELIRKEAAILLERQRIEKEQQGVICLKTYKAEKACQRRDRLIRLIKGDKDSLE